MNSRATRAFWACYRALPQDVRALAAAKFRVWKSDPFHPSLQFKLLRSNVWSVRINLSYRAMGWRRGDEMLWFWVGTHGAYDSRLGR